MELIKYKEDDLTLDINEGVNSGWVHVSYNSTISLNRNYFGYLWK